MKNPDSQPSLPKANRQGDSAKRYASVSDVSGSQKTSKKSRARTQTKIVSQNLPVSAPLSVQQTEKNPFVISTENGIESSLLHQWIAFSSDAIILSCDERIVFSNPAALRILGASEANEIAEKSPVDFVKVGSRRKVREQWQSVLQTGEPLSLPCQQWRRLDGKPLEVEVASMAWQWQNHPALLLVVRDVSTQRRLEKTARRGAEILRRAIEAAGLGTWDWDIANNVIVWNDWHYRLLGLEPASDLQNYESFIQYVHPDDREPLGCALMSALQSGEEFHFACRVVWPDGSSRWMRSKGRVIERDNRGHARRMSGVIIDITDQFLAREALQHAFDEMEFRVSERTLELTQLNEQLQGEVTQRQQLEATQRDLLNRLVTSQEDERHRISRELHDQMGQNLVALMLGLKSLPEACESPSEPKFSANLHRLQNLTTLLMDQVHNLAWELRPASLDNLGLEAALAQYVQNWSQNTSVKAEFLSNGFKGKKRLSWPVETALYRAVQEALVNVSKHAKAQNVAVLLEKRGSQIVAIIEDDGIGFDTETQSKAHLSRTEKQRLGLLGMQERLSLIGGSVEIESALGQGTTVFLRAPLECR